MKNLENKPNPIQRKIHQALSIVKVDNYFLNLQKQRSINNVVAILKANNLLNNDSKDVINIVTNLVETFYNKNDLIGSSNNLALKIYNTLLHFNLLKRANE
jgi:hypothetical protein